MHALKGLSQLGIGSPTNKDIKGKKLTPSGGVRVTGPGESGNAGTVGLRDKFPQEMDKCLRACRSHDKIRNVTEESKLGNRSSSWVRLGSPIPGEKCRNSCNKSNEKRLAINKLRGGRLAQKRNSQAETGHLLSPKRNPKLQLKTSLLKTQTPAIPETSFLKSPKKSLVGISELQQTKLLKGSDQKKIKGQVEVGDRKKKKQSLHKLHEQLQNMNSETDGLKLQPKPKKNLKEYILNFAPPNEDSQLKRNKSLKKAIDHDFKRTRVGAPECLSGDEDIASLVQKISQSKIKMPKVTFKPMLMPAKDLNQVGSLQRAKSPGTKSKKTLSVHIPEIPESLKQKITDLMSKKKSIDQGPKPAKKTKSKFVSKKIPKTPSNDLVSQLVDPSRAKSPKQILRNQKKKKVQKKLMGAKPLEEIEFEGRIYTLKENSKATTKKQRESGSHQYIDIDLNNDSDRLKPRHSMSSDEEGTPHSKGVIIRTPTVGSNLNGHSASHSGLKNLVGFQSHVELDDIVGAQSAIAELEAEQNAIVEQPVRIPAYNNQKETIDEPAKVVPTDHPSGSQSRRKSKGSSSEKKNLIINTGSKAFDQAEVDSIVVIEQSDDGQVKKVDEGVQVSLETFRRSEKDVLRMKSDISIIKKEDDPFHQNFKLEDLAKEEYKKWSQVNSMLKDIEERIGAKAATEIKELFSRLDTFANQSKKNLKEAFLASDMCMSNQLSERKPKVNEEMNGGFSREQRFGAVFNPNDTHDDSSRNNSFHPSVILSYQPQASSKKTKTYKKNEMEVWPDGMLPHSSSATPNSMNHKQIL